MSRQSVKRAPRARVYLGMWRRLGGSEHIPHIIIARTEAEAIATSEAGMRSALGPRFRDWKLESIRRGAGSL